VPLVGDRGVVSADIGRRTAAEREADVNGGADEESVVRIAGSWSVDPERLGGRPALSQLGVTGVRRGDL